MPPVPYSPRLHKAALRLLWFGVALVFAYIIYGAYHFNPALVATRNDVSEVRADFRIKADEFRKRMNAIHAEDLRKMSAIQEQQKRNVKEIEHLKARLNH